MKKMSGVFLSLCVMIAALSCERWHPRPVRIGICPWPGYEILRLAHERGFFADAGLNVQFLIRGGTTEIKKDFIEGKVDLAALTLYEAVDLILAGEDVLIPLILDYSKGADGVVVKKSLLGINGLKGRKVGLRFGSINYYILSKALEKHGMSEGDIQAVDIDLDEVVEAFADGRVDALAAWEPYLSKAAQAGDGIIPFTSRDLSVPVVDVLVVRREFALRRPADVKKLIQAWFKTIVYFKNNYPEAVQVLSDSEGVAPDIIKAGFEGVQIGDLTVNREAFGDGRTFGSIFTAVDEMTNFMRSKKIITDGADPKKSICPQYFFESQ